MGGRLQIGLVGEIISEWRATSSGIRSLMTAQAFGAVVSCAYPWHRVDHNHDDADTGRQVRGFEPLRMQWYPA
jgi:hypothetical protein